MVECVVTPDSIFEIKDIYYEGEFKYFQQTKIGEHILIRNWRGGADYLKVEEVA